MGSGTTSDKSVENKWVKAAKNQPNFTFTHGLKILEMIFIEEVRQLLFNSKTANYKVDSELVTKFLKVLVDPHSSII